MNRLIQTIKDKARKEMKTIVLPESNDERVVRAAEIITREKLAKVVLIGSDVEIKNRFPNINLDGIKIINNKEIDTTKYSNKLFELRKEKGMTQEESKALMQKELYFGVMLVKLGEADGLVGGACHSTGDMLRPALQIVKTAPNIKTVSSCFIMLCPNKNYGDDGIMVFADCAVNVNPTAEQLADIALASAETAKSIAGINPRVAMLSFSTKGSAQHECASKVVEATEIVKRLNPSLVVDGELQLDSAIVPSVAAFKCKGSQVEGKANVLIFPDLQSGNIGYKLVERLAGAEAVGPICQGFNSPLNDLSRGCSVEDIVNVTAITAVQAQ
ncbi:MAG: phosphate acetyltransferase [Firmicutes bacterium]|nr:phosphate acetyltransferase [Bacillota bacterium]MCL2256008.1 phosphate acetyltransferase [Bacillota bacterium]